MVGVILNSGSGFGAVKYNGEKIEHDVAKLLGMENVPYKMNAKEFEEYLNIVSQSHNNIKNKQFHLALSVKGHEFTDEQMYETGKEVMARMGYKDQPYMIVCHHDTDNKHIHIISTRVTPKGEKINDSFERKKLGKVIDQVLKEKYNIDPAFERGKNKRIDKDVLLTYRAKDKSQIETLLKSQGYKDVPVDSFNKLDKVDPKEKKRISQILLNKKNYRNNTLDTNKLKASKLDIVYHKSPEGKIFGYSVIDHKNKVVYKGSDITPLKNIQQQVFKPSEKEKRDILNALKYSYKKGDNSYVDEAKLKEKGYNIQFKKNKANKVIGYYIEDIKSGKKFDGKDIKPVNTIYKFNNDIDLDLAKFKFKDISMAERYFKVNGYRINKDKDIFLNNKYVGNIYQLKLKTYTLEQSRKDELKNIILTNWDKDLKQLNKNISDKDIEIILSKDKDTDHKYNIYAIVDKKEGIVYSGTDILDYNTLKEGNTQKEMNDFNQDIDNKQNSEFQKPSDLVSAIKKFGNQDEEQDYNKRYTR